MPRSTARRILAASAASLALVALLSACQPIEYDGDTDVTTSAAEWRVAPITTGRGVGVEVRFRNCNRVHVTADQIDLDQTWHLRPAARITDAEGKVFFDTMSFKGEWVQPAGSQVVENTSDGDDLQRIVVPVVGARGALRVESSCTSYQGFGGGLSYTYTFTPCTTATRRCAMRTEGLGVFNPGGV